MGMFDWLTGSKKNPDKQVESTLIWITDDAKFRGIEKAVAQPVIDPLSTTQPVMAIMLVAYFEKTFSRLSAIPDRTGSSIPAEAIMAELKAEW